MTDRKKPPVDQSLVDWLSSVIPNRCPNIGDSEREIWIAVGRQDVIQTLRALAKEQSLTVL